MIAGKHLYLEHKEEIALHEVFAWRVCRTLANLPSPSNDMLLFLQECGIDLTKDEDTDELMYEVINEKKYIMYLLKYSDYITSRNNAGN